MFLKAVFEFIFSVKYQLHKLTVIWHATQLCLAIRLAKNSVWQFT